MIAAEATDGLAVDTDTKLDAEKIRALVSRRIALPGEELLRPILGIARYVPRGMVADADDIDADEAEAIASAGVGLWIVQHCYKEGWHATAQLGADMGGAAAHWAHEAGYPEGAHLAFDLEGCGSGRDAVIAWAEAWSAEVAPEYVPLAYSGYMRSLDAEAMYRELSVKLYWKAPGPWDVAVRGCAIHQHLPLRVASIEVDPDILSADNLGGRLVWAVAAPAPPPVLA